MKTKRICLFAIMLSIIFTAAFAFTSCAGKPGDLETFLQSNESIKADIDTAAEAAGMKVEVKGNDIIYTYDLSSIEGVTEEMIKDEAMVSTLQSSLDGMGDTFVNLCKMIEEKSEFTDVRMIVNFIYGEETLASQTFTYEE